MKLKELRELKDISTKELSREIGLPYTTYRNYEIQRNEPNQIRVGAYILGLLASQDE